MDIKNDIWIETDETLLCCHGEMHEINIDPVEFKTKYLNSKKESLVSSASIQSLTKSSTDLLRKRSKETKRKSQHSKTVDSSESIKLAEIDETTSPWVTVDDSSISPDIVSGRQMIQFYSNPLLDLPDEINVRYIYIIIGINLCLISFIL